MRARTCCLLVVALLMSLVAVPGSATSHVPSAEVFAPESVERMPQGGPPDAVAVQRAAQRAQAAGERVEELADRRTASSRTFRLADGSFETEVFATARFGGDGLRVLGEVEERGSGMLGVTADGYELQLPQRADAGPVRIERDGVWVAFGLQAADGVEARVEGARAIYPGVQPGVDLVVSARPDGVKEELVLAGPDAPREFTYMLSASGGLEPVVDDAGRVRFVDVGGEERFVLDAPFMVDARERIGVRSPAVEVSVGSVDGGWELAWRLDDAWLDDPARQWPVTVDPTVMFADGSCLIASDDGSWCSYDELMVGLDHGEVHRGLIHFDVESAVPAPAVVSWAALDLTYHDWVGDAGPWPVDVHRVTREWSGSDARWSEASSGVAWDTAGGDFDFEPAHRNPETGGTSTNIRQYWYLHDTVQDWIDGEVANHGLLVKAEDETQQQLLAFVSDDPNAPDDHPRLRVFWSPLVGEDPHRGGHESWQPAEGVSFDVNVVSGNLMERFEDVTIAGTAGMDLRITRTFNQLLNHYWHDGVFGPNVASILSSNLVVADDDRSVAYNDPESGFELAFARDVNGDWRPSRRIDADLADDATYSGYALTWRDSQLTYRYDGDGLLRDLIDRNGNTITVNYSGGLPASITDSQGRVTTIAYNIDDRVEQIVDPAGREHDYLYDTGGYDYVSTYTDPAGNDYEIELLTGPDREVLWLPDGGALVVEVFNTAGYGWRVTSVTEVTDTVAMTGPTTTFAYDEANRKTTVTDPRGKDTVYHYDRKGAITKVVDALGRERDTSWSAEGLQATTTNSHGQGATTFTYATDGTNNLTGISRDTGTGATLDTSLTYDDSAHPFAPTRSVAPQGTVVNYGYDTNGNLNCLNQLASASDCVNSGNPAADQWHIDHNADGTVAQTTDPKGNVTDYTWTYDTSGVLDTLRIDHPSPRGYEEITFDPLGRIDTVRDGNGQVAAYGFDVLDRLVSTTTSDISVTHGYDEIGNRTTTTDPHGTTSWDYELFGQLIEESLSGPVTLTYDYDDAGNLTAFTGPGGTVTYTYDDINRIAAVTDPGSGAQTTTFDYTDDMSGQDVKTTTYPDGTVQTERSDQAGRLDSIAADHGSSTLTFFDYTYETGTDPGTPLRSSVTDHTGATTTYGYDHLDRLTDAETRTSGGTLTDEFVYTYDDAGNRLTSTQNTATTTYAYNGANQMTAAGSTTFTYDDAGNQTGSSEGQQLDYTTLNQTSSARQDSSSAAQDYEYLGATQFTRTAIDTTGVINSTVLGIVTLGGVHYTRTPDSTLVSRRDGTDRHYYLHDGLGSTAALVDDTGTVTNRYTYSPYGATTIDCPTSNCAANPFQYTGAEHDQTTGLYKIGHRYYQPDHGRWTQPDPLENRTNPTMPTEAHPYLYAGCNPINYTDPSGLLLSRVGDYLAGYSVWYIYQAATVGLCAPLGALALLPGIACGVAFWGMGQAFVVPGLEDRFNVSLPPFP